MVEDYAENEEAQLNRIIQGSLKANNPTTGAVAGTGLSITGTGMLGGNQARPAQEYYDDDDMLQAALE
jgi:hypothetical protein